MRKVAVVVEGKGDVSAISTLIAKTGVQFGTIVFASDPPIRAGEVGLLSREGELERILELAASREDTVETLVIVDLDDGCAATLHAAFRERASEIETRSGKPVHFCFCVREFEAWFLADLDSLRQHFPEYGWTGEAAENPEGIRGAKERLRNLARSKGYKPMRDQALFTKKLNLKRVALASRSFRKLVKNLTGMPYSEILEGLS